MKERVERMVAKLKKQSYVAAWNVLALTRILVGFVFFWAFLDKTFGLGFATQSGHAWINGSSPTTGFLKGVEGPFSDFFTSLAGNAFIDGLFMFGLFGLGVALILGIGVRIAAVAGTLLLAMLWAASLPLATNPLIDDHVINASILWLVALAPRRFSLANIWTSLAFVKKRRWLW